VPDDLAGVASQRHETVPVVVIHVDEALRGPRQVLDGCEEAKQA
jgi:hypothetical protein